MRPRTVQPNLYADAITHWDVRYPRRWLAKYGGLRVSHASGNPQIQQYLHLRRQAEKLLRRFSIES